VRDRMIRGIAVHDGLHRSLLREGNALRGKKALRRLITGLANHANSRRAQAGESTGEASHAVPRRDNAQHARNAIAAQTGSS
jgi:hypothetical protein